MALKDLLDLIEDTTTVRLFETQENDTVFIFEGEPLAIDANNNICDKEIVNINVFDNVLEIYLNY